MFKVTIIEINEELQAEQPNFRLFFAKTNSQFKTQGKIVCSRFTLMLDNTKADLKQNYHLEFSPD